MYKRPTDKKRGKKTFYASRLADLDFFHQKTLLSKIKVCSSEEFTEMYEKQVVSQPASPGSDKYVWCSGLTTYRSNDGTVVLKIYWSAEAEYVSEEQGYSIHRLYIDHLGIIEQSNTPQRVAEFVETLDWKERVVEVLPKTFDDVERAVRAMKKENWPKEDPGASVEIEESEREYGIFSYNPHPL